MLSIETKILNPLLGDRFPLPKHATSGAAGLDIHACIEAEQTILPGKTLLVDAGFAINIKDPNIMAILVARSGLGIKKGIVIAQGAGIIDSDYHGEIKVALWNRSEEAYVVQPGDRICQMLFVPVMQVGLEVVDNFATVTERGSGGLGSTGRA
jgi:dUTP pyrophosphatase